MNKVIITADSPALLSRIGVSSNARAPKADISKQPYLFGDIFGDVYGDADDDDYGDLYEDGDIDDEGDPMDLYLATAGDPLTRKQKIALAAAAGGITGIGGALLAKAIRRKRQNKLKASMALASARKRNSLTKQRSVINNAPKMARASKLMFTYLSGGNLTQAPLVPGASFVTDTLKYMLDKASVETPFFQFVAAAAFTTLWTADLAPATGSYYYPAFIVNIGSASLTASPGTIVQVNITACTLLDASSLTTAGNPWIFTYRAGFDSRLVVYLWKLVANKPMPTLGVVNATDHLTVTVAGIPSTSAVTLTVPGSQHPWTLALRGSLVN